MKMNITASEALDMDKELTEKKALENAILRDIKEKELNDRVLKSLSYALDDFDLKKNVEKAIKSTSYYTPKHFSLLLVTEYKDDNFSIKKLEKIEKYKKFISELEELGFFPKLRLETDWDYGSGSDSIPEMRINKYYVDVFLTKPL